MVNIQAPGRARLPVPARDRRPALAALALLLVVLGALGSALVVYRTGNKVEVLVTARPLAAGQQATGADFTTTRVSSDSTNLVPASNRDLYAKAYAVTNIPKGTLVNQQMFLATGVMPPDGVIVGVVVDQQHRPATPLAAGDIVRAYFVPTTTTTGTGNTGPTQTTLDAAQVIVSAARVLSVVDDSSGSGDSQAVSLLVGSADATKLVNPAASTSVALGYLPPGTKPPIDFLGS